MPPPHLPLLLRRTYTTASTAALTTPPRRRPLLDRIALSDPAKLADTVRRRLARGDVQKAIALAVEGGRVMNVVVSWNHVIKYNIENGWIKKALSAFNTMKKRGIKPDSHTFTILLSGLSQHTHYNQSLSRALQLYHSLSLPKTPVTASIIHTNAILKVCARAHDLDSMWSVVGKLPAKGQNAPNATTYTTLLNGILHSQIGGRGPGQADVEDGRRVWAGVLARWGKGQLEVDEGLACAMGRVLLKSEREEDWMEVFTLVEQVFGIPSFHPPPTPSTPSTTDTIFPPTPTSTPPPYHPTPPRSFPPPTPTPATLSLLLQAATALKSHTTAHHYWTLLLNPPYTLTPDLENYHDLLRLHRRFRSGPEALSTVTSMLTPPSAKTFYIALSACKRGGGRGPNFACAEKLLLLLQRGAAGVPVDVKIWTLFLSVAVKSGDALHVKSALRRIDDGVDVKSELSRRLRVQGGRLWVVRVLELLRGMVAAVDVVCAKEGVRWGHGERDKWVRRRNEWQGWITKYGRVGEGRERWESE